jgi:hypothetical protein
MDDEEARELLAGLTEAERDESWRLALPNGRLVGYGAGLVELARSLRLGRPAAGLLERIPPRVLDGAYHLLSERRDAFARLVPDGPGPRRFP